MRNNRDVSFFVNKRWYYKKKNPLSEFQYSRFMVHYTQVLSPKTTKKHDFHNKKSCFILFLLAIVTKCNIIRNRVEIKKVAVSQECYNTLRHEQVNQHLHVTASCLRRQFIIPWFSLGDKGDGLFGMMWLKFWQELSVCMQLRYSKAHV